MSTSAADIIFDNCSSEENVDISTSSTVENCTPPTGQNNKKRKIDSTDIIEKRMEDAYNIMKSVCDKPKKNRCQIYGELLGEKLSEFDEKTQYFLMHEMDTLILKTKFQIENQLPSTSQPNYLFENLNQNVPTALYNSYHFPTFGNSASSHYSQPSSFSYAQQLQHPQNEFTGIWNDYR